MITTHRNKGHATRASAVRGKLSLFFVLGCLVMPVNAPAQEDYGTWIYEREMYINTTATGANTSTNVEKFPILVRLSTDNFNFSQALGSGEDLRFSKTDSTLLLHYEIEHWDSTNADAAVWVLLDTIYANNKTQYFRMFWGKSGAADSSKPESVFDTANGFAGVWHLGNDFSDRTANNNDGADNGSTTDTVGMIGRARYFNGTSSYIPLNMSYTDASINQITSYTWFKTDFSGSSYNDNWSFIDFDRSEFVNYYIRGDDGRIAYSTYASNGGINDFDGGTPGMNDGQWHCAAVVYDGADKRLYVDGVLDATQTNPHGGNPLGKAGWTRYGFIGDGSEAAAFNGSRNNIYYQGFIDELRFSHTVRSDDWIKLCYETQRPGMDVVYTLKYWDGGGGDSLWSTAENWNKDELPGPADRVIFDNSSTAPCYLDTSVTISSLVLEPEYSGTFYFGGDTLRVVNDVYFVPSGAIDAGGGALEFCGTYTQTLNPVYGQTFPPIIQSGAGGTVVSGDPMTAAALHITNGTFDLGDDGFTHTFGKVTTEGGALDFGTSTLSVTGDVGLSSLSTLTAGAGVLSFNGTGSQVFTPKDAATTHPMVRHTGIGTLTLAGSDLKCASFFNTAGILDFNGFDITTTGNFIIDGGTSSTLANLDGRTITATGGIASFNGKSTDFLNLNVATGWTVSASAGIDALYATIDNSTVSSSPPDGEAQQCIDGGTNSGWTFINENYDTWDNSRKMYLNTTALGADVSGDVLDFPLLVRLSSTNFTFSQAMGNGEDLRFGKPDGTPLVYEIEAWDSTNAAAAAWVKLDTVYGNNNAQYFWMYWGKSGATDRSNPGGVFSVGNDFTAVWHLHDTFLDATSNNCDGENGGTITTSAVIGDGRSFDGNDSIAIDNLVYNGSAYTGLTVSAWFKTTVSNRVIASWDRSDYWRYGVGSNGTADRFTFNIYDSENGAILDYSSASSVTDNTWRYCTATYGDGYLTFYVDGEPDAVYAVGSTWGQGATSRYGFLGVGSEANSYKGASGPQSFFNGSLDEFRISESARSANWVKLCYETQKSGASVIFSPVTWDGGGASGRWSDAANWSENVLPTASDEVIFNATSTKPCTLAVDTTVKSIAFASSYTGNFHFSNKTLRVTGAADFSTGGTISENAGAGTLEFTGATAQTFVPHASQAFPRIRQNGTGATAVAGTGFSARHLDIAAGTFDLADNGYSVALDSITASGGGIDFGNATVTVSGAVDLGSLASLTPATATLVFPSSAKQVYTPYAGLNPRASYTGSDTLELGDSLYCASLTISSGTFAFNGNNLATAGALSVSGGSSTTFAGLGGRILTIGGSATLVGQSGNLLNLDPSTGWRIKATGTLIANYTRLDNADAGGGTMGEAYNCIDVGNPPGPSSNTNWDFIAEDYEASWGYGKRAYINTTSSGADVSGDVSSFPLLIRLDNTNFTFSEARGSGEDIRFANSSGTPLYYEVENWDSTGEDAAVWVNMDQVLGNNKTQYVKMFWGNDTVINRSNPGAVFSVGNGYEGVWHLHDDVLDATSNNNDGASSGTTNATGVIGDGEGFSDAATSYIALNMSYTGANAVPQVTVSGWFKTSSSGGGWNANWAIVDFDRSDFYNLYVRDDDGKLSFSSNSGTGGTYDFDGSATGLNDGTWHYATATYDGTDQKIYVDGELDNTASNPHGGAALGKASTRYGFIGDGSEANVFNGSRNNLYFTGSLDEVRVDNTARSADWIKLCYETQKPGASCVSFSSAPVVTGLNDAALVGAAQRDADTVVIDYEVEDPDGGTVTISAQYKVRGGSIWTGLSNTTGDIGAGIDASSGSTDRQIRWGVRSQLGSNIEKYYFVRVVGDDGAKADTAQSDSFFIDTRAPTGLANLAATDSTGNSVSFSWDIASDANFDHYELWYGLDQGNVQGRSGGAGEWDENDDAALATITTAATTITGLLGDTLYYFKVWAVDSFNQEMTIADISNRTMNMIAPIWTRTSMGAINGGAIHGSALYVGTGASSYSLRSINPANGTTLWSVSTSPDPCGQPTYIYSNTIGKYRVLAAAGNRVVGRIDNGGSSSTLFGSITLTSPVGTPYPNPDDSTFIVAYNGNLTVRDITDGSELATWPVTNISTAADPVVFRDEVYVATTDGDVIKGDLFDFTPLSTFSAGAAVNQPLWSDSATLYVAPDTNVLYAVDITNMSKKWEVSYGAYNTGPPFMSFEGSPPSKSGKLYVTAEDSVYRITDGGTFGTINWRYGVADTVQSGATVINDVVYFGSNDGKYHAISDNGGSATTVGRWPYDQTSGEANEGPWITWDDSVAIYGTSGGYLDAFDLE